MNQTYIHCVTMTNAGYIEYTDNLLNSINENKTNIDLNVYALDKKTFDHFKKKTNTLNFFDNKEKNSEFLKQNDDEFGKLMLKKFEIIYDSLIKNDLTLYIDGDIVIKKNFSDYILKQIQNKDIIFQNDKRPSKANEINLCAGFMLIKSNKKTLKIFEPTEKLEKIFLKYKTHDQTYLNKNKNKLNYGVLPLHLFPNGPYYYKNFNNIDPFMIHFNYLIGHVKKEKMIEFNEWYNN